ncbi:exocyst complex component EXO70A1-like [Oryza brachyantha]|uniref:exocyst complex component EXO70A1-like n=1 Tax=Oryza brachyantha TaxID=4533 RepID=UPI001ADD4AE1|nr:exocyst complex component EXO70A1-like [Oryza brachyantha]
MGAAPGKAAPAAAADYKARFANAEHVILQWNRSPLSDTGIWDAAAACTNERLLDAVDEILDLAEAQPFPASSADAARLDGALGVAMSRMMDEFLRLRVWNALSHELRYAIDKLSVAVSANALWIAFPSTGARSSSASTVGRASGGSPTSSAPGDVAVLLDGEFLDELELLCPASLPVLDEIALRVIRAGYTKVLVQKFKNSPCDVLDRFLSIFQVECSRRTTEAVIKRWSLATKLVGKALVVMQRQLYAQSSPGAFDALKDEYFLAITKNRVLNLLKFADDFTSITSHEKLVYILGMYEALSDAAPGLLLMFTGVHKELVSERTQEILTRLASSIRAMVASLLAKVRDDVSTTKKNNAARGGGVGVHPLTRYAMDCIEPLAPHRDALDLILASGGGGVTSLSDLASRVVGCLDRVLLLEEKPVLPCGGGGDDDGAAVVSRHHLFVANNAGFVLQRGRPLLGNEWAAQREDLVARHVASYAEARWAPVVASLETAGRKPANAAAKFSAAFDEAYESQARCEVPDPTLRDALRKAASETVVPAYGVYLKKHPKLEKKVRYTAGELDQRLSELFEGEAAERNK